MVEKLKVKKNKSCIVETINSELVQNIHSFKKFWGHSILKFVLTHVSRYAIREKWYLASYKHISQWKWPKHLFIAFKAHITYKWISTTTRKLIVLWSVMMKVREMKQTKKILSLVQFSGNAFSKKNNGLKEWLKFNEKLLNNTKIAWFIEKNRNLFQDY